MKDDPRALVGQTLRGYKIIRLLGEGGMGAVFEGHHEVLDRSVALKVIKPELASNERLVKRFLREAKALARFTHPCATAIYEFGRSEGVLFMALELVAGRTLRALLDETGAFAIERAVTLTLEALSGLEAAHALNIIHRDLKPENIMVTGAGAHEKVKILDFGLVKFLEEGTKTLGLTAPGTGVGTISYAAPEQLDDARNTDRRADLYAVGLVLYELLTGQNPYEASSVREIMRKKLAGPPPSVRLLRPEVPVAIETLLARSMALQRGERFQDARSFADALEVAKSDRAPASDARPAVSSRSALGRRLRQSGAQGALRGPETKESGAGRYAGRKLHDHRLERLVAPGRAGDLYEALDSAFDRMVHVKVTPHQPGALERLRKEALLLARIGAPDAYDVIETGVEDGLAFLVLLGVSGRSLQDLARETGRFPLERAIACGLGLLAALEPLHALGVVHRDVAPGNVLVGVEERGETFRLLDYSLAADAALEGRPPAPFASPEQERGVKADVRSDIFSVAAIVRSLLQGDEPVPEPLATVLARASAPRPEDRFVDARTFAAALEASRGAPAEPKPAGDAPVAAPASLEGERVGRYLFKERLEDGPFGELWKGVQLDLKRPVALRLLPGYAASDKELAKAMVHAARAAARVVHPAVATVHEVVITGPRFVAQELVTGEKLGAILARGPLPVAPAVAATLELLSALAAVHAQGLVHGALEPDSVVLTEDGRLRLVDLALAPLRPALAKKLGEGTSDEVRGRSPPERVPGEAPGAASDLFAAACLLSEMLTGQRVDLLVRSPRRARPEVPEALDQVVLKALALRPEGRYADANALAEALRAFVD